MAMRWLRQLANRIRGRKARAIRKAPARCRLAVEPLEERVLLATQVFDVTTTADEISSNGLMSLREAILQANDVAPSDGVVINLQLRRYEIGADRDRFQPGLVPNDTELSVNDPLFGDFDIRRAMTINGNGAFVAAAGHGRVFDIRAASGMVVLNNLTAQGGRGHAQGGGVYAAGGLTLALNYVTIFDNEAGTTGGGLYVDFTPSGQLFMTGGEVSTNQVSAAISDGGGVYVHGGQVTIEGTKIALNSANGEEATADGGTGGSARGGGLYTTGVSQLTITRATFDGNNAFAGRGGAAGGSGGLAFGGAVSFVGSSGTVNIRDTQFTNNRALGGDGGTGGTGAIGASGGYGGFGAGGAVAIGRFTNPFDAMTVTATIEGSLFDNNFARGGNGGNSTIAGGRAGDALGGAVAFDNVTPAIDDTRLTVTDTLFRTNVALGGLGGDGMPIFFLGIMAGGGRGGEGGDASGGGVYAGGGVQSFTNSPFLDNRAVAGNGGQFIGVSGGGGGDAFGGAIASAGTKGLTITGEIAVTGPVTAPTEVRAEGLMQKNLALGGAGGTKELVPIGALDDVTGAGGNAHGGAVAVLGMAGRPFQATDIVFEANQAMAGNGGSGVPVQNLPGYWGAQGGGSGSARGGAVYTLADTTLTEDVFRANVAAGSRLDLVDVNSGTLAGVSPLTGGPGGLAPNGSGHRGGSGGIAEGGAVFAGNRLAVSASSFVNNQAAGGMGGFGSPGVEVEGHNGGAGGQGGAGGSAWGGAVRAGGQSPVSIAGSVFLGNMAVGGRGGSGGQGGRASRGADRELVGGTGGQGGDGGEARGGSISIEGLIPSGFTFDLSLQPAVTLTDVLVSGSRAIAGDGGFAGNGGAGAQFGGPGGNGGDALGGGADLQYVRAVIDGSTFESNVAVAGDGAAGGYGGGSNDFGGAGGRGGDGGCARGGAIAFDGKHPDAGVTQNAGSLDVSRSTVVGNQAIGGNGGNGGFGGPGYFGGAAGGDGGSAGDALGGGIYATSTTGSVGTLTNVTIARNYVEGGDAGFGSPGGQITDLTGNPVVITPIRYDAEQLATSIKQGASRVLDPSYQGNGIQITGNLGPTVDYTSSAVNPQSNGLGGDAFMIGQANSSPLYIEALITYGVSYATSTTLGGAAVIGLSVFAPYFVGWSFAGAFQAGTAATIGAGATAFGAVSLGAAVASIGVVLIANVLIDGILTGDWRGAVERTLGTPGSVQPYTFTILLTGVHQNEYDPPSLDDPRIAGRNGRDGSLGNPPSGSGLYGPLTLARTAVAGNAGARHDFTHRTDGIRYLVVERYVNLNLEDVAGGAVEAGGANQKNFIGAVNSGFTNSLKGTTANPLDAKFDTQTRFNGGIHPTLKLLPGSPLRQAVTGVTGLVSQNDYTWSDPGDIGAWGGPRNRAPVANSNPFTMAEDSGTLTAPLGSDPDNDVLAVAGSAPVAQHGTVTVENGSLKYTPAPDWFGRETLAYQVTDGEFTRDVTTVIDVTPVNDAPVPHFGQLTINEDEVTYVDLWDYVTDIDTPKELLQFRALNSGSTGTPVLQPDGHTVKFTPLANYYGPIQLFNYLVTDPGDGAGPAFQDLEEQIFFDVLPVNDAPVNVLPATPTVAEDTDLVLSGVSVSDVDDRRNPAPMRVTLSVQHGALTLGQTTGLTFTTGDGAADAATTFSGSLSAVNAALASATYRPDLNFNGTDTLTVVSDDMGNYGAGGPLTTTSTLPINVMPVNDAPTLIVPGAQSGYEDVRLALTGLSVADIDLAPTAGVVEVTLSVASGTLRLGQTTGLTFTAGGNDARSMTFRGTLSAVNAALAGLSYLGNLNFSGADALTILVNDLGNIGTGGPLTAQATVAVTVLSSAQQAANLGQQVTALKARGVLTSSQADGLLAKLNLLGNNGDAGKVTAFISQVNGLFNDGVLTRAEADALLFAANILLKSVTNSGR